MLLSSAHWFDWRCLSLVLYFKLGLYNFMIVCVMLILFDQYEQLWS